MTDDPPPPFDIAPDVEDALLRLRRVLLTAAFLFLIPPLLLLAIKKSSAAFLLALFAPGWISCLWIWRDLLTGRARRGLTILMVACAFVIILFFAISGLCLPWILDPVSGDMDFGAAAWGLLFLAAIVIFIMARSFVYARALRKAVSPPAGEQRTSRSGLFVGACGALVAVLMFALSPPRPHASNDASALASLRTINTACVAYLSIYGTFPSALSDLQPGKPGAVATPTAADLIDFMLASGVRYSYRFRYAPAPAQNGVIRGYSIHADPVDSKRPWERHLYTDESLVIRFELKKEATAVSSPLQ